jgi:oligopeptide/dipeptide ABC transporter ATP-binding protein
VDDVSFNIPAGRTVCLVGESGCGKSVTAQAILRLVPSPPGKVLGGQIKFGDQDLLTLKERQMRHIRGDQISMIFQEPMTSLNPVLCIGTQLMEMFVLHRRTWSKTHMRKRSLELLDWVGIPDPKGKMSEYPHQLSGGMRQRVMIAMALACEPKLLIADEPTTALDVTIQAQILELFRKIQQEMDMALMLITHDFGVVAEVADEVVIMYAGQVIETGSAQQVFEHTQHPYTHGLLKSIPRYEQIATQERLYAIPKSVPALHELPPGCRFSNRCQYCVPECTQAVPELIPRKDAAHPARCIRPKAWESL